MSTEASQSQHGMKQFFIDNHGCAKNQVDAEEMATRLTASGWTQAQSSAHASLIIVNSCGFIEDAKKESLGALLSWRAAYPDKRIILAGCLAQRYAEQLDGDLPEADYIFGNGDLSLVPQAADNAMAGKKGVNAPPIKAYQPARRTNLMGFPRMAYLKLAEGCSNHCAFCAIPIIRGELSSRDPEDVAQELRELVASGIYEICLIGQDLGSYGIDRAGSSLLPQLLEHIRNIDGDFRVRMLYIHPDRFPSGLLDACARDKRILPYFDIPFQHASTPILKAMNRSGNAESYMQLVSEIRKALPDAVIRTTFLLGFPGENDEDLRALLDFQAQLQPDWLGAFTYSREEDTPAYGFKGRVPKRIAVARKRMIEQAQETITQTALSRWIGYQCDALVEERIEGEDLAIARGPMNAPDVDGSIVIVGGNLKAGDIVPVRIEAVRGVDLEAVCRGPAR
ncbi:MAG TPA: 30S ribosomal protein S12 methylthiotransferase RimO [Spirochaetales bacterium]|nr:30S ribosomal protein S12 methylthiotransferase RimO [Spirochaetales bacterium]